MTTQYENFRLDSFVDRLYLELSAVPLNYVWLGSAVKVRLENKYLLVFDDRKYYDKAVNYRSALITAAQKEDYPSFTISLSDISKPLKEELLTLSTFSIQIVLRQAILRIFQNLDEGYNDVLKCNGGKKKKKSYIFLAKEVGKILKVDLEE